MFLLFKTVIIDDLTLKENCVLSAIYHLNRSKNRVLVGLLSESLKIPPRTLARVLSSLLKKEYITINKFYDQKQEIVIRYYYASAKTLAIYQEASGKSRPATPRLKKREVPVPTWYNNYKKQMKEQDDEKVLQSLPKDIEEVTRGLFGDD